MTIELNPASRFSLQELTDLYNRTRVDYLVPMPMNAGRLAEYIHDYDVDLARSFVAREPGGQALGLGMLGVRTQRAWITRLGVLTVCRRGGIGAALVDAMLATACDLYQEEVHLEVIKNNEPAYGLFLKKGFHNAQTYLVMRRAPRATTASVTGKIKWLDKDEALRMLRTYPCHLTWINAYDSMCNASDVQGVRIEFAGGDTGWLVYRAQKFYLSHLVMHTEQGDPVQVGTQLLTSLYSRYPRMDTYAENISVCDPHLPAFHALAFFENFSRIEMHRPLISG